MSATTIPTVTIPKRTGRYAPTIEDAVELSGIETLHPGGAALTRRTAEVVGLGRGVRVLDVSSGRGTQSLLYASEYGADVTGLDIADEMVATARRRAAEAGIGQRVRFVQGDSQQLPFEDGEFDVVINECAVGIPDDPQRVLGEMVRVARPGGMVAIHESTWGRELSDDAKTELAERYGTTPMEQQQWLDMLGRAGLEDLHSELTPWSRPENFWKVRAERDVKGPSSVLTWPERLHTLRRIVAGFGWAGVLTVLRNERLFYGAVRAGKIGYGLYWGRKSTSAAGPR